MKSVKVRVSLPAVTLRIDGEEILLKEDFLVEVMNAKELRHEVYSAIFRHLHPQGVQRVIAKYLLRSMPKVELGIKGKASEIFPSIDPTALSRATFSLTSMIAEMKHILKNNPVVFTLEDGRVIQCPLRQENPWKSSNAWRWTPLITDGGLQGKEKEVKYNSSLHVALFRINANKGRFSFTNLISANTRIQLIALRLVREGEQTLLLTQKGEDVLRKFVKVNPAEDKRYWHLFATALIGYQEDKDKLKPVHTFARDHGYVINKLPSEWAPEEEQIWVADDVRAERIKHHSHPYGRPTRKGAQWLEEHSVAVLRKTSSQLKRENLIPFLPLEHLPKLLVSEDQIVVAIASRREAELRRR